MFLFASSSQFSTVRQCVNKRFVKYRVLLRMLLPPWPTPWSAPWLAPSPPPPPPSPLSHHHSWCLGSPCKHYAVWPPEGGCTSLSQAELANVSCPHEGRFLSFFQDNCICTLLFWGRLLIHNRIVVELDAYCTQIFLSVAFILSFPQNTKSNILVWDFSVFPQSIPHVLSHCK